MDIIPFSPPRIDDRTIAAVAAVLRSGWITTGPQTKLFERRLAEYCGVDHVLCMSSATAGLELALRWFGVGEGDEVIVPAYTYCATANVVVHCGAKPVMVDVRDDFTMDPGKLKEAITERTKAVIPVDVGGLPCDYDAIRSAVEGAAGQFRGRGEVQEKLGRMLLLADAAHSLGATYGGRRTGRQADVTVFSFHAVKNLTTAEGGAVAFNLPEGFDAGAIHGELSVLLLHGQTKDALAKSQSGNWRYDVTSAGYKWNMTDIQAAMGLVEIERYDSENLARRREIFRAYADALSPHDWAILPVSEDEKRRPSWHVYMLRIGQATEDQRDRIISEMYAGGVAVNVHFIPLPLLTYYRSQGYDMAGYPSAARLFTNEISLPVYYGLSDGDVKKVVRTLRKAVEGGVVNGKW